MQRLGPYLLEEELARGGVGSIHRARAPDGKTVAIKVLHAGATASPAQRARFGREARVLSRLRHPELVTLLDLGEEAGVPYLVLEYVPGESLAARLQRGGPLPPRQAVELTARLARALAYAHEQGALHRDLSPSNILIDAGGRPRLTDFGLAQDLESGGPRLSLTGAFYGTPGYWSPEQATGDRSRISRATDIYGLGAVLYACLTGQAPCESSSVPAALTATLERPATPPSALRTELDPALDALCLRCLEKDPARRYPDMRTLAEALEAWLDATPRQRPARGAARWAAAILLGGAGLAAALMLSRQPPAGPRPAAAPAPQATAAPTELPSPLATGPEGQADLPPRVEPAEEARALREQGWALVVTPRKQEVLALFERALSLDPSDPLSWVGHGLCLVSAGDRAGGLADYARALELDPDCGEAYLNRGALLMATDPDAAWADNERAIALLPREALPLTNRASLLLAAGDAAGALADADAAIALDPDAFEGYNFRVASLDRLGRREEALATAERCAARWPDLARAWSNLGMARAQLDQNPAAIEAYTHALELDPENLYARMGRAGAFLSAGELRRALPDLERVLPRLPASDPRRPMVERDLARCRAAAAAE